MFINWECPAWLWENAYLDWWDKLRVKPEGDRMWRGGSWHHWCCWNTAFCSLNLILQFLIPWESKLSQEWPKKDKENWILSRGLKPTRWHFPKKIIPKGVLSSCIVPISITKREYGSGELQSSHLSATLIHRDLAAKAFVLPLQSVLSWLVINCNRFAWFRKQIYERLLSK